MELRAYADAYQRFITSKGDDSLPAAGVDPMLDLVFDITYEQMKARGIDTP